MKFPRVIRLDSSDLQVFAPAAAAGEPAVPGSFAFAGREPETLTGKERQAFASGWLGTESFGRASLVEVGEISEAEFFQLVERLARHFVERYSAPDLATALHAEGEREAAARELLEIVRRDRAWDEEAARKQLLKYFEAWGPSDPLTLQTRRQLSTLLFS